MYCLCMHLAVYIVCSIQTKIPIIYIDSLVDGCMILYMIFDNQMEKIFMIGLFPSCVYVLWIFSTTYMNYLHPSSMCIICTKKRSLLHILSALDCQKTRIKAAWPRRSINGLHRIPNRAWRIDGIYASMLWSETFKP